MMSIVTESGSQEKFSFGEIKYRDDKTKLIEEIRLLNDQNKLLKNRIKDSIREIKEREKDVQGWRSAYNLLVRYIGSQTKSRCDCEICQIHDSMPASFTLADIAKSKTNFIDLSETHSAQPRPSKDDFFRELGLIKNSERSQFSRLKLVSESHSSAYPNENFRKLSRRRFAKDNRNDLANIKPTRSRYEFGNIPWPKQSQTHENNPSTSPAKKRQFLKPKQLAEEKPQDREIKPDERDSEPPVAKRKKLEDSIKSEINGSLGDFEKKDNGKEMENEKLEMHKKVPGLSEVILATRVNNSLIAISNNHNRGPKLQSRLNTVRNASSKTNKNDKKPKRPPGRPHGSLTNMTPAKLDRKAKLSRLANNFELKNPKGGPKYHEAYSGTIVKSPGSNGQKFKCYYCSKQYTVRQMVRFHTEEHHYDLAVAKLKELSEADKNIFKNMIKIPPLPD